LSRDLLPRSGGAPDHGPEPPEPRGRIRPTRPGAVAGFAVVGLVLGWVVRPAAVWVDGSAPTVGWLPALALLFVALIVASVAWSTHRVVRRARDRLDPRHAVNRLVLAKACVLAGALYAGGYFGFALSWVGVTDAELARERIERSVAAGVGGVLLVVASLLLERACRVRKDR
jgi:hypothetical protein